MLRPSRTRLLALTLALAAGCTKTEDDPGVDAGPMVAYEPFDDVTWSMAVVDGGHQLSVTDATGALACGAVEDLSTGPVGGRHQLILHIADDTGTACPAGSYDVSRDCPTTFDGGLSISGNCAYYRAFDANGALLGSTRALNGTITVNGTDSSCTVRPLVGFTGGNFSSQATFANGAVGQTSCAQ